MDEVKPDYCTCNACGYTWDYNQNPTPAHRCPREADHEEVEVMSKSGEKFTEERAKEYEDRGANRSEELADLLTIAEMTDIIAALSLSFTWLDGDPSGAAVLAIRSVMWEARAIAERNEYAGDYDYPEDAS